MRSEILTAALAELAEIRSANSREEIRRLQQVRAADPLLAQALDDRQEMVFSGARAILSGADDTTETLPERMRQMNTRIRSLLAQHGFSEDYLEPIYHCKRCRDTGYVGEPVREMCECLRAACIRKQLETISLVTEEEQSFATWRADVFSDQPLEGMQGISQRDMSELARRWCQRWCEAWPQTPIDTLVLSGASGLGKTFLLHCMYHALVDRGARVTLISAYKLLETARKAFFENRSDEMAPLLEADVLMIDDLGAEPLLANVTLEQLYYVLNERQNHRRSTVFSTNLSMPEIRSRYTERIASRLSDKRRAKEIQLRGEDIRRRTPSL